MFFQEDIIRLSQDIKNYFTSQALTLSGAESCTGGLIGGALTAVPGSSDYFMGSAVTYSNEAKMRLLKVSEVTLQNDGAVSFSCAREMAEGARKIYGTDLAFSVTGVAGPDGGSLEKPVGTVWFGFCGPSGSKTFKKLFPGDRESVRAATLREVLEVLRPLSRDLGL